jgi:peptide/nickel transport system permease protein
MILARNKKSAEPLSDEALSRPPDNPWVKAWHRLLHNRAATIGLGIIVFFILIGIFADVITPYDPIKANFSAVRQPPSLQHLMGTDKQGREIGRAHV